MSSSQSIDWGKAAAAWAAQRQKSQQDKVPSTSSSTVSSQPTPIRPPMGMSFPGMGILPQLALSNANPATAMMMLRGMGSALPTSYIPFPTASVQDPLRTFQLPIPSKPNVNLSTSWISESAAKDSFSTATTLGGGSAHIVKASPAITINTRSVAHGDTLLTGAGDPLDHLTPLMSPIDVISTDAEPVLEDQMQKNKATAIKQRAKSILSNVTDSLLDTIARETLNEAHLLNAQRQQAGATSNFPLMSGTSSTNAAALPTRSAPPMILPASTTHALQLQLSFAARPVQPVVLGEAGQALEEDHDDLREEADNGGLPFIVPEEPTKGLFRAPPDVIVLPEESTDLGETHPFNDRCVKVVSYSRTGQVLGELYLNGRRSIIFGSNPRQANVIDSHSSVYSQHCAIGISLKTKPQASKLSTAGCSLYLFPLGGTTKIFNPEQIPFRCQFQPPGDAPLPPETPIDVVADGSRKREIPINTQIFIQLSSSQRCYLIDASCWKKSYVTPTIPQRFYSSESLERAITAATTVTSDTKDPTTADSSLTKSPGLTTSTKRSSERQRSSSRPSKRRSVSRSSPRDRRYDSGRRRRSRSREMRRHSRDSSSKRGREDSYGRRRDDSSGRSRTNRRRHHRSRS